MLRYVCSVRIRLRELRRLIREKLNDSFRDVLGPEKSDREQVGSLGKRTLDPDAEEGSDLPLHLRDTDLDIDDLEGPVSATAPEPYVTSDPNVRDASVLPTKPIYRG